MLSTLKNTFYIGLSLIVLSCTGCDQVERTRNDGLATINDAIQKLGNNSNSWQSVLSETKKELIKEGQSTLANEVSNVASRAVSDAGIEVRCTVDFMRDRVREELIKIRSVITGEKLILKPVFCNPTPNFVDLNLPVERRPIIEISGYNLTANSLKAQLIGNGESKDITEHISNPSGYLLTLNIGSNGVQFDKTNNKIEFELPDGKKKTVSVIQPSEEVKDPEYLERLLKVNGKIYLTDKDWPSPDDHKTSSVSQNITVKSGQDGKVYWEDCVAKEVQGYLDSRVILNKKTGAISVIGTIQYYEGEKCGRTNLSGDGNFNFTIGRGQSYHLQRNLSDDDGSIRFDLTFSNPNI